MGASQALTGKPETFCENPDLVATEEKYAWGAGTLLNIYSLKFADNRCFVTTHPLSHLCSASTRSLLLDGTRQRGHNVSYRMFEE